MTRNYELKARAETQEQTRQRIVEATVELHEALGPAKTTVTAIAARAGVGRLTVYRHFPDHADLFSACSNLYWDRHPAPDPEQWRDIADPIARLRVGLRQTYGYHRQTEAMMSRNLAEVGDAPHMRPYHEHWKKAADVLASGFDLPARDRKRLRAVIGHAVEFGTWRSLTREQALSDKAAIQLMVRFVTCLATDANRP